MSDELKVLTSLSTEIKPPLAIGENARDLSIAIGWNEDNNKVFNDIMLQWLPDENYEAALRETSTLLYGEKSQYDHLRIAIPWVVDPNTGGILRPYSSTAVLAVTVSTIKMHAGRGRWYASLKDYGKAIAEFKKAQMIYEALMKGNMIESGDPELNNVLGHLVNANKKGLFANKWLTFVASSVPEEYLGYAGLLQSMKNAELMQNLDGMVLSDEPLLPQNFENLMGANFKDAAGMIDKAVSLRKDFTDFVDTVTHDKDDIIRFDRKVQTTKLRIEINKASYFLEVSKRLRIFDPDHAGEAASRAIKALSSSKVLMGDMPNDPPEEILSALLTLGWGYSTLANLEEDKEVGSGRTDALRAAAIYQALLYGSDSLTPEMAKAIEGTDIPAIIKNKVNGNFGFIQRSAASISRQNEYWIGFTYYAVDKVGCPLMGELATNVDEITLNLADALSTAKKYDGAITEYKKILKSRFKSKLIPEKARSGLASAKINKATDLYFNGGDYNEAIKLFYGDEGAITLSTEAATGMTGRMRGIQTGGGTPSVRVSSEFIRSITTSAWAYATMGRIENSQNGRGDPDLQKALDLYQAIHYFKEDDRSFPESSDPFESLLNGVNLATRGINENEKVKIQIETNVSNSSLHWTRGDDLKDLKHFKLAIEEYAKVSANSIIYKTKAEPGTAEAMTGDAAYAFDTTGDKKVAIDSIDNTIIPKFSKMLSETDSKEAKLRLLLAMPYGVRGGVSLFYFDRETAKTDMVKAQAVYYKLLGDDKKATEAAQGDKELAQILDMIEKNRTGIMDEAFLNEMHLTKGDFYLTLGDLLKAGDPRDEDLLKMAKDQYENAKKSWEGSTDIKAKVRIAEAEIAISEVNILRAKNYMKAGDYANALTKSDEIINSLTDKVPLQFLIDNKAEKDILKLSTNLAWAYGVKGGLKEDLDGDGAGQANFMTAASIYNAIAYGQALKKDIPENIQPIIATLISLHENLYNEDTLESIELTQPKIHLILAELLKSAGSDTETLGSLIYLDEAEKEYTAALELYKPNRQSEFYMRQLTEVEEAKVGLAESLLLRGKIREENNEFDAAKVYYKNAINKLIEVVASGNTNAKLNLRTALSLAWAFSAADGLKEIQLQERGEEKCENYYLITATIYRALIENKDIKWGNVLETVKAPKEDYGVDLKGIEAVFKMIDSRRADMANPVVLDELDISRTIIDFNYVLALISAKKYDEGLSAFRKIEKTLDEGEPLSVREEILRVATYVSLGDVFCWKKQRYEKAKDFYLEAMKLVNDKDKNLAKFAQVSYSAVSAHMGLAAIYAKHRKFDNAFREYNAIIDLIGNKKKLKNKDKLLLAKAHIGIGNLYCYSLKNDKSAMAAYQEAMALAENYPLKNGKKKLQALILLGEGDVERTLHYKYEEAIKYYDQASSLVSDVNDQDGAKIRAKIDAARAAAKLRDWKEGLDFDSAILLYDLAIRELDRVCSDDIEAEKTREKITKQEKPDAIAERAKRSFQAGISDETKSSSHKGSTDSSQKSTITKVELSGPLTRRIMWAVEAEQGDPGVKIGMNGKKLLNYKRDMDNPYIPEDDSEKGTLPYDYTKQNVQDSHDVLKKMTLPLFKTENKKSLTLRVKGQREFGRYGINANAHIQSNFFSSDIYRYSLANYPQADSLKKESDKETFRSVDTGGEITGYMKDLIPARIIPNTFYATVGGSVMNTSAPYATFSLDKNRINSKTQSNKNTIDGNNGWIAGNKQEIQDKTDAINGGNLTPEDRQAYEERIAYLQKQNDYLDNGQYQNKDLAKENKRLKNELDDKSKNKPLTEVHGQVGLSITLPYEILGIENPTAGYGLNFNIAMEHVYDEIAATGGDGFWRSQGDPNRTHLLFGIGNKFYVRGGILSASGSYSMPFQSNDGTSLSANLNYIFTSSSAHGFTPEVWAKYDSYADNLNKSQSGTVGIKIYSNRYSLIK